MKLLVRRIDSSQFEVQVPEECSVTDLKRRIHLEQNIPIDHQRIIYQGRVLKDDKYLRDYHVAEGSVLHMVANPPPPVPPQPSPTGGETFSSMMPNGVMMGAIRLEGNTDDPNLSQNIIAAITQAMQSFVSPTARVVPTGAATAQATQSDIATAQPPQTATSRPAQADEGAPRALTALIRQVETVNAFLSRNVPSIEAVSLSGDGVEMRAYSRLMQSMVPMLRSLESCLMGTVGPVRSRSPQQMASLLTAAASLQQTSTAMQSLSRFLHSLVQHGDAEESRLSEAEEEEEWIDEPPPLTLAYLHWIRTHLRHDVAPGSNLASLLDLRSPAFRVLASRITASTMADCLDGGDDCLQACLDIHEICSEWHATNQDLQALFREELALSDTPEANLIIRHLAILLEAIADGADPESLHAHLNDGLREGADFFWDDHGRFPELMRHLLSEWHRITLPVMTAFAVEDYPWHLSHHNHEEESEGSRKRSNSDHHDRNSKRQK